MPTIITPLRFPDELPLGLFVSRSYQTVNPLKRSTLVTGRARQRRAYTNVPTMGDIRWLMTSGQAQLFENWFRWAISDGAQWFSLPLRMPDGLLPREVRFTGIYDGPNAEGPNHWRFTAEVELRERQVGDDYEYLIPGDMMSPEIFDLTMNREWPEFVFDYATYADALADLSNLSTGALVTVQNDENQGGKPTRYQAYVAPPATLILDFANDAYYMNDKTNNLMLVTVWDL